MAEVLLAATPLIFTGLAVAVAFRVGYYNIGAEGQFLAGAMATTAVALSMPDLPPRRCRSGWSPARWAVWRGRSCRRSCAGGSASTRWSPPCCSTLWRCCCCRAAERAVAQPRDRVPRLRAFGAGYELPSLFGTRVHAGLLVGLVLVAVTTVVLLATPLGVRLRGRAVAVGGGVLRVGRAAAVAERAGLRGAWPGSAGRRR